MSDEKRLQIPRVHMFRVFSVLNPSDIVFTSQSFEMKKFKKFSSASSISKKSNRQGFFYNNLKCRVTGNFTLDSSYWVCIDQKTVVPLFCKTPAGPETDLPHCSGQ